MIYHKFKLHTYSNYFKVSSFQPDILPILFLFVRRFIKMEDVTPQHIPKWKRAEEPSPPPKPEMTVFASATVDGLGGKKEFRFHINALPAFLILLDSHGIKQDAYIRVDVPPPQPLKVDLPLNEGWAPRDYQMPVVDFAVQEEPKIKLIGLNTGEGKTSVGLFAMAKRGERFIIAVKPGLMDQWERAILEVMDIPRHSIMHIKGGKSLKAFLTLCQQDMLGDTRIVIISNKTYQMWLKAYEEMGDGVLTEYPAKPQNLCELFKAGTRLIDEVHLDFHLWFKMDLFTNVANSVSMSATLKNLDPVTESMYVVAYPHKDRRVSKDIKAHTKTYMVGYDISDRWWIKTQAGPRPGYSQIAFEKSIMREKVLKNNYIKLVSDIMRLGYVNDHQEKSKAMVFCGTVDMCTAVTQHLSVTFPEFTVKRYTGEDPIENLKDPDIRVTTIGSAGTGHDIPGLSCTIQTVGVKSIQAVLQTFGRLREPKGQYSHLQTKFYYLYANTEKKHQLIRRHLMTVLKERSKTMEDIYYPVML